jgi:uncharacterized membrane protein
MFKKIALLILFFGLLCFPSFSFARVTLTDWYIQDFDSKIVVNKDSSLDIIETIKADCGNLPDKHGIFRILPTQVNISGKKIQMPVELIDITDQAGNKYAYQETKNSNDGTVTWKIGDANKTVQGVNTYIIKYKVENTIRFGNEKFDEFYWNLNGNFWTIQTDKFHASIVFPSEINKQNATVEHYTGLANSKEKSLATYAWTSPNVLEISSNEALREGNGITASIIFPKNIIAPYAPSLWRVYGEYLFFLIPLLIFIICFLIWKKYGEDPRIDRAIIAEYSPPADLSPIEMGTLMKSGGFENSFITAEIIWLATRGLIVIKEIEEKVLFFSTKDHELTQKHDAKVESTLNGAQQKILQAVFVAGAVIKLSSLKNKFYTNIKDIQKVAKKSLVNKNLIQDAGIGIGLVMKTISPIMLWLAFVLANNSIMLSISLVASAVIIFIFGFLMPRRTPQGAELNWQIEGFKLFMETVDKDRAAFYEKENIFEKCLPYAILFGMTKQWIKKMQDIYGADYLATHSALWYVGGINVFNADNFASSINGLSSDIAASTSSPSGSGGSGGSGGGGGGGGGGGW